MNEDFVPFELAKKLKEKGFPQHITEDAYIIDNYGEEDYQIGDRLPIPLIPDFMDDVSAPTISQVLKWLRTNKKIYVYPHYLLNNDAWMCFMYNVAEQRMYTVNGYNDYEQAAIAGINYVLYNII